MPLPTHVTRQLCVTLSHAYRALEVGDILCAACPAQSSSTRWCRMSVHWTAIRSRASKQSRSSGEHYMLRGMLRAACVCCGVLRAGLRAVLRARAVKQPCSGQPACIAAEMARCAGSLWEVARAGGVVRRVAHWRGASGNAAGRTRCARTGRPTAYLRERESRCPAQ